MKYVIKDRWTGRVCHASTKKKAFEKAWELTDKYKEYCQNHQEYPDYRIRVFQEIGGVAPEWNKEKEYCELKQTNYEENKNE